MAFDKYVTEHENEHWAGCLVRVPRTPQKLFSYGNFATARECREAAYKYRDACLKKIGGLHFNTRNGRRFGGHHRIGKPMKNNKLRLLGVSITKHKGYAVVAQLVLPNKQLLKARFRIKPQGKQAAIARACAARKRFEKVRDRMLAEMGWPV